MQSDVRPGLAPTAVAVMLIHWCIQGMFISERDLRAYTLQHAGIEALAERGTFNVSGSPTAELRNVGDVFAHRGQLLAAKQPGQFMLGSISYRLLMLCGFRYANDFRRTAALVTWLSSGLILSASVGALFYMLSRSAPQFAALAGAAAYGFGSTAFSYLSVPHHDVIATSCLVLALAAVDGGRTFVSGSLISLSLLFSMLVAPLAAILAVHALYQAQSRRGVFLGLVIGALPLAATNTILFGAPWIQANVAGNFTDTFWRPNIERVVSHAMTYLGNGDLSVWKYIPVIAIGWAAAGWCRSRWQLLALTAVCAHLLYILGIETVGHCQWGPRYLLPLAPLGGIGFSVLMARCGKAVRAGGLALLAWSSFVQTQGALTGTMYCDLRVFGPFTEPAAQVRPIAAPAVATLVIISLVLLPTLLISSREWASARNSG